MAFCQHPELCKSDAPNAELPIPNSPKGKYGVVHYLFKYQFASESNFWVSVGNRSPNVTIAGCGDKVKVIYCRGEGDV